MVIQSGMLIQSSLFIQSGLVVQSGLFVQSAVVIESAAVIQSAAVTVPTDVGLTLFMRVAAIQIALVTLAKIIAPGFVPTTLSTFMCAAAILAIWPASVAATTVATVAVATEL